MKTPNLTDIIQTWLKDNGINFYVTTSTTTESIAININNSNLQLTTQGSLSPYEVLIISNRLITERELSGQPCNPNNFKINVFLDKNNRATTSNLDVNDKFLIGFTKLDCRNKNFFEDLEAAIHSYFDKK
jgi:hypothetical protein